MRELSNTAFREHRVADIAACMTDDMVITTGEGNVIHGKDSLQNYVKPLFERYKDLYFVRDAGIIKINESGDRAWESGTWKGLRPETPDWTTTGGQYAAMWMKKNGVWKIRSELFVRLY